MARFFVPESLKWYRGDRPAIYSGPVRSAGPGAPLKAPRRRSAGRPGSRYCGPPCPRQSLPRPRAFSCRFYTSVVLIFPDPLHLWHFSVDGVPVPGSIPDPLQRLQVTRGTSFFIMYQICLTPGIIPATAATILNILPNIKPPFLLSAFPDKKTGKKTKPERGRDQIPKFFY